MALNDRDYFRGEDRDDGYRPGMPWFQKLIIANVVIAVLDGILAGSLRGARFAPILLGYFSFEKAFMDGQVWRVFTYQFLHGGLFHLLSNMIALYFFGPLMEQHLGRRRFLAFYLICGVSGAVVMSALSFVPGLFPGGPATPLIGASGSIYGILAATAALFPNMRVQLIFPPVEMRMRTLAGIFFGIIIFSLLVGSRNAGGEACHLGGALLGYYLARNGGFLRAVCGAGGRLPKFRLRRGGRAEAVVASTPAGSRVSREEIDRILDKISQSGLHSLTPEERRALESAREEL